MGVNNNNKMLNKFLQNIERLCAPQEVQECARFIPIVYLL